MTDRQYDIIVYGSTGYTGTLVAQYLALNGPTTLSWAIAGRNHTKLQSTLTSLKSLPGFADRKEPGIAVADSGDKGALLEMVRQTKVVISTTGPFLRYGTHLVEACAESGTHYADITGEVPWVQDMIAKYHDVAKSTGAIVVPQAGYDSLPFDLGVETLVRGIREQGKDVKGVRFVIDKIRGRPSGGTLETIANMFETLPLRKIREAMTPYALSPLPRTPTATAPEVVVDTRSGEYIATSFTERMNGAIVERSWGLLNYGSDFSYREYLNVGKWVYGYFAIGLPMFVMAMLATSPGRWVYRKMVRETGTGPTKEERESGCLLARVEGESSDGSCKARVKITGKQDPGYGLTSLMLAEVGLCLAYKMEETRAKTIGGGVLTTACLGEPLREQLEKAGFLFEFELVN
ncbi:hypothetical protein YB2330_001447 [Saitoella coloradoensis]